MTVMSFDIDDHEPELTALIQTASDRSLQWFRTRMAIENKAETGFDPVTAADRAVEDELRAALASRFPDHVILGEERGVSGGAAAEGLVGRYRWVIDPIDGTRAFVSGQPMWGTLVGLQDGDDVIAGWLHQPPTSETYLATPRGARRIDRRGTVHDLATSAVTDLADAILLNTHPSMFDDDPADRAAFERVVGAVRMTRYSGDCVNYGLVASGDADLVVENQLQPYDIIPLIPIIEHAGGVITDLDGRPPIHGGWAVAAATPELHAAALSLLTSSLES